MRKNSLRWIFNCRRWLPNKDDLQIALSCIQEEERSRIFNFYYQKDLKLALIGQLMLRRCVSDCLDIQYDQIQFIRTNKGKPVLPDQLRLSRDGQPFDFNISHDGDYCVLAAESINKIGVDISKVKESNRQTIVEYFKTMERIFSPQEWVFIKDLSVNSQSPLHRFHRLWALKESFVKAEAIGIGYELRRIQFNCPTACVPCNQVINDTLVYHDGKLSNDWIFEESLIDDNHFVSVALSGDNLDSIGEQSTNNPFKFVRFDTLIDSNVDVNVEDNFWVKYNAKEEGRHD